MRPQPVTGFVIGPVIALVVALTTGPASSALGVVPPPLAAPPVDRVTKRTPIELSSAPDDERAAIDRLLNGGAWVRRAIATGRLTRFECDASAELLRALVRDPAWQVRCYALLACARRSIPLAEAMFAKESEGRVLRTALRCRFSVPRESLAARVVQLGRSESLEDKMLALELALGADLDRQSLDRDETLQKIIMRMDRAEAGNLSPRLAAVTSGTDSGRSYRWREWYRKNRRELGMHGGFLVPASRVEREPGALADLDGTRFVDFERHVSDLALREVDLAILLDCTASMSGELAECQAGIDALMLFAQGVAKDVRIAVIGYRDRRDRWETQAWDLTRSVPEARERLWSLSAEGGGDRPESVDAALRIAYGKLSWRPQQSLNVILIGDAPPHPGTGETCVTMARQAHAVGITTYAIAPHAEFAKPKAAPEPPPTPADDDGKDPSKPHVPEPGAPAPPPADIKDAPKGPQPYFRKRNTGSPWRRALTEGEVEYFKEIAEAGGGRAVALPRDASLIAEIAGITFGASFQDEVESFFDEWIAVCR